MLRTWLEVLEPSTLLTLAALLGFVLAVVAGGRGLSGRRRGWSLRGALRGLGWTLLTLALAGFAAVCFLPVHYWALRPLEERFPPAAVTHVDGVVVVGGAIAATVSADREIPTLNRDGDRLAEFAVLARRWPEARLVFAGGPPVVPHGRLTEAAASRSLLESLGVDPGRVLFDERSLTTWGNAVNALALAKPKAGETWLLVTSASHMPRAMGAFRGAGWPPMVAWPVAFRTTHEGWPPWPRPMGNKLAALDLAAHEWVGLVGYWWEGRTDRLFPGP